MFESLFMDLRGLVVDFREGWRRTGGGCDELWRSVGGALEKISRMYQ